MKPVSKLFQLFKSARLATLLCSVLLVSCGGGAAIAIITSGIGGTGISFGTVLAFASIIVNGSELDSSTVTVTLDDNPPVNNVSIDSNNRGGLKEGMVVKVSGDFSGNSGTASTIVYKDNLEGEVCAISSAGGITTLRVLGQTVIQDATTIVDNGATISVGDIIEVSGLPDDQEQIHASFIENKTASGVATAIEVKGRVDTVDVGTKMLTINALNVDYSGLGVVDNSIPGGVPSVGQFVEVKGTASCNVPNSLTDFLTATVVELETEGAGDISANVHNEVEGLVTVALNPPAPSLPATFTIGNQIVQITSSTRFTPQDFVIGDIVLGTKIEAQGTLTGGVLIATKLSLRENVKLESNVATVIGSSFTLIGLPGITITTNSSTKPLGVTVNVNDTIRVRGIEGPNNTVLATRIQNGSGGSSPPAILQGVVDDIVGPSITVLGTTIDTSTITVFKDINNGLVSSSTFLGLVQKGTIVKFKSASAGSTITWDEAQLEDD